MENKTNKTQEQTQVEIKEQPQTTQVTPNAQSAQYQNPYSQLDGVSLNNAYNTLYTQKQYIDNCFYYASMEMQNRYAQMRSGQPIAPEMIPPAYKKYENPEIIKEEVNGKVVIREKTEENDIYANHILLANTTTVQQKNTDKLIKELLKKQ